MVEAFCTQEGDDIMLRNVTITNNTASFGGGISNYFTPINFANTIIAGNTATDPRFTEIFTGYAAVTSLGGNLVGDSRQYASHHRLSADGYSRYKSVARPAAKLWRNNSDTRPESSKPGN